MKCLNNARNLYAINSSILVYAYDFWDGCAVVVVIIVAEYHGILTRCSWNTFTSVLAMYFFHFSNLIRDILDKKEQCHFEHTKNFNSSRRSPHKFSLCNYISVIFSFSIICVWEMLRCNYKFIGCHYIRFLCCIIVWGNGL